jgi:glycosyltransferase involved in cell wall biosynthesis
MPPENAAPGRRLLIATDAWRPQINGVVRSLEPLIAELEARGWQVRVIGPDEFPTLPMPTYSEIKLALPIPRRLRGLIRQFQPDYIHIATEGPLGWAMRWLCLQSGWPFSTCFHTRFPEYLRARAPVPVDMTYLAFRHFHNAGYATMVATQSLEDELAARGFTHLARWGRGVDLAHFSPEAPAPFPMPWPRPLFLTVGRLAREKNLEAFLSLDLPGTKLVVGDGPDEADLKARWPDAVFLGALSHEQLAGVYANADVFVFPSRTDTFGLVLIEALATGLPVAAYPAPGPIDIIGQSSAGVIGPDLRANALAALQLDRRVCRTHALSFTWKAATDQFIANVTRVPSLAASWPKPHHAA